MMSRNIAPFLLLFFNSAFSVKVEEMIFLVPNSTVRTVMVGKQTFVACNTQGTNVQRVIWTGPGGDQITSYNDSVSFVKRSRIHVEDSPLGHRGAELHFSDIVRKDAGKYTCSAHVDGHDVSKSFTLIVEKAPDFSDTPKEQVLEEGKDSVLRCNVEGFPKPTISWFWNGNYLQTDDSFGSRTSQQQGASATGGKYAKHETNENWIVVKHVTKEDGGQYLCDAKQLSLTSTNYEQFPINVIVHHKPETPEGTRQSVSYLNGVVNLTCEAVAEPKANFTWMKDDVIITPSEDIRIFHEGDFSIMELKVTNESMFGDYICIAENHLGKLERVVPLEEGHKPSTPEAEIVHVGLKSLKLSLSAQNHPQEPIKGYRIEYKQVGEEWSTANIKNFGAGKKEYVLDGLQSDVLYVLRASSKNEAGYSDPTYDLFGRTKKTKAKTTSSGCHPCPCVFMMLLCLFCYKGYLRTGFQVPLLSVKRI